ncbi:MAG: cation:dicarboxylase symporter family transporter, partial [Simkaniaceae bacterium]|nr:cation:dicarboxylase symporter family transporter [Simkaniaceae bacterium]
MRLLKSSLTTQVLLAIAFGIFLGITFGPICSIFKPIGTAFVMFIQMVIILYIPSSIIHGIGSTKPFVTKQIFRKGWFFLLCLWGLVFLSIF